MDTFRADVAYLVESRKTRYIVQTGVFVNKKNAEKQVDDLASAGFNAIIKEVKANA